MSFLTIPSQEGLFTTIKTTGKSAEETRASAAVDDDEDEDDEEDEEDEDVRLIPRCSPVPRKRGASIHDETAEYIRIHSALSAGKRVSFADTTGGDLVDVKEFVAFDSDEEEGGARWGAEGAKRRQPEREPTYRVHPEFRAADAGALLQAVRANKVEVEQLSPVEHEPLAFCGLVRVLNISYHKAVYVRATMDSWASYFDHPADYVQGSHDGDTDQFSFKLSFAPPYITHGSRIEFVVRYETSHGDFWANNSHMNYVISLLLSYEDSAAETNADIQPARSILKPPKDYSMNDFFDSEDEEERDEGGARPPGPGLIRPSAAVCPATEHPEMDVEIPVRPSGPSAPPKPQLPPVEGPLSPHAASSGKPIPPKPPGADESRPPPELHCELAAGRVPVRPVDGSPQRESRPRSESAPSGEEESPASEDLIARLHTTEMNLWPAGGDGRTESSAGSPRPELPAERVSPPLTFEREVAVGSPRGLAAGLTEETPRDGASPELSEPDAAPQAASASDDAPRIGPPALADNPPNSWSEPEPGYDASAGVIQPSVAFLTGVVSLSVVMQEPSALFYIGLLLVLTRL